MTDRLGKSDSCARLCVARECVRASERVPRARVAREARLSIGELIRRFAALFGETPHQYRLRERLDSAKRSLADGGRSVTDVCLDVGFSSVGSFSAWFARRVGLSPTAYRRRAMPRAALPPVSAESLQAGCLSLLAGALAQPAYRERNFGEAPRGVSLAESDAIRPAEIA
jgi:AraC-like DNA-binding protein